MSRSPNVLFYKFNSETGKISVTTMLFTAHCASDTNKCAVMAAETCCIQCVAVSFSFEHLVLVKVKSKAVTIIGKKVIASVARME
jgi:hypothetical protein